jgi:Mn2+/Fe2+ NRAMP family transporter
VHVVKSYPPARQFPRAAVMERREAAMREKYIGIRPALRESDKPSWIKRLGPGLVTDAADDDPSGIGTYSQAGAQFGFSLQWTLFVTYPLMTAIRSVSARIGGVTGKGLATDLRQHCPTPLLHVVQPRCRWDRTARTSGSRQLLRPAAAGSMKWRNSLALQAALTKPYYAVVAVALLGGIALTFTHFDPVKALYWGAVVNGVASVPVMVLVMLMAGNRRVMGECAVVGVWRWGGWIATAVMGLAGVAMFLPV